ncbi:MAG TPA: peptidylprolyl isomerase [Bacteroidetes bacterium]|jgi:FKBP-type peptidyl-prolyl cis-trans isomerase SlyD|nr:peptidylprolyl isomerase [Bacteroidota bacterium]
MLIGKDTVVGVNYALDVDGMQLDASGDTPLTYLHGHGMMIPGFERQLEGLAEGDTYDFMVTAAEGYGELNPDAITDLDKQIFLIDGNLSTEVFEGAQLQLTNQDGQPMVGVVAAVGEDTVTMDFNHQLAGKDLHFAGSIAALRAATEEEIAHGHVHGPGGHNH